jgi:hypothetical protein
MLLQPLILVHLSGILFFALLFYTFIPGIGAFAIRSSWRKFRHSLAESAIYTPLDYRELRKAEAESSAEKRRYRFFGHLQAMQGDNTIWVSDGKVSVSADLERVFVYVLSEESSWVESGYTEYPVQPPRKVLWEKISSLPEYTQIFLSGELEWRDKRGVFKNSAEHPLLVIIYEGEPQNVLIRAAWSGRQKNEYWNSLTPGSLTLGSFSLFIYFYILMSFPKLLLPAIIALSFSLIPVVPLFPPAVLFYYYYRGFWKRGRVLRAQRDLIRVPLMHFHHQEEIFDTNSMLRQAALLKTGERYLMTKFQGLEEMTSQADDRSIHFIQPSLPPKLIGHKYYLFSNEELQRPSDPMAEMIAVPGSPFLLVAECEKRAGRYELLGLSILAVGIGITELLVFVLFSFLLV